MVMIEIRGEKSQKIRGESLAVYHSEAFNNSKSKKHQLTVLYNII